MPNLFAHLILYSYPLIVLILFRRLERTQALIWSIMGGYLFLPERVGIDLPLLPPLDKTLIPSLSAMVMCLLTAERTTAPSRQAEPKLSRRRSDVKAAHKKTVRQSGDWVTMICIIILFAIPAGTFLTNREPVIAGPRFIGGLSVYDIFAMVLNTGVMLLPFFLARRYLNSQQAKIALLKAFVAAGITYAVLILIEVRLSPQLNKWVYGFYSHSFEQHIRAGGFRPMIFIEHGLRVGIFMAMTCLAALTLYRVAKTFEVKASRGTVGKSRAFRSPRSYIFIFWGLFVILFLSKAVGAFAITLIMAPIFVFWSPRLQGLFGTSVAIIILLYPTLRAADLVPVRDFVTMAQTVSEDRASSLQFRLNNEDILLDRALQKPLFGWGGWGRSRVFDPNSGEDLSVTDGTWVIAFGSTGWLGYLALFGLLAFPALKLVRQKKDAESAIAVTGLSLMLVANLIDLIPNSGLTPLTWMLAGTLSTKYVVIRQPHRRERSIITVR